MSNYTKLFIIAGHSPGSLATKKPRVHTYIMCMCLLWNRNKQISKLCKNLIKSELFMSKLGGGVEGCCFRI